MNWETTAWVLGGIGTFIAALIGVIKWFILDYANTIKETLKKIDQNQTAISELIAEITKEWAEKYASFDKRLTTLEVEHDMLSKRHCDRE